LFFQLGNPYIFSRKVYTILLGIFMVNFFTKFFVVVFLLIDDIVRGFKWLYYKGVSLNATSKPNEELNISRSDFLVKTAVVAGSVPLVGMSYGIISGAYDYRIRHQKLVLPNLPKSFDGIKLAQLSDIHSGSFYNKTAVQGGVDMLLNEKPDFIFFTGDLVNNKASELNEYYDVFKKIKAPLGVYSVLGNHDYGDYVMWESEEAKRKNLERLKQGHAELGWNLMMNEHIPLVVNGEKIDVIGIENYGAKGRFPKYGKLDMAHAGSEADVKLLLSHDPSHWDAQVNAQYKDIDVTFSGHTHGFQFGIENQFIKWSPVQYMYKQWGGLYKEGNQQLYVNRGFGFLGFPGRIGMPPEITIFELVKG